MFAMKGRLASALMAGGLALAAATAAAAQEKVVLKVVGTWGNLSNWTKVEQPFWNETLPKASNGMITAQASPQTELGLKGFEIMRLLKLGVFDVAHALPIYIAEDATVEGMDLAGVARDFATARKITEAYEPVLAKALEEQYNAKLLNQYPFPSQIFYCNKPIDGIESLAGRKIRVQGASQGDFVEGLGANPVTIAFAEVVPSLQKGVVDCGITGTMPAYKAKWHEVATHAFPLRVGFTVTFTAINMNSWNKLDPKAQETLLKASAEFEDNAWKVIEAEDQEGIFCSTGTGPCSVGEPADMTLVEPTDKDFEARDRILRDVVLKRWAQRCGADCAERWNETVGKVVGLTASGS